MSTKILTPLPSELVKTAVHNALKEDIGLAGDITTNSIFPSNTKGTAHIKAREAGTLAGRAFVDETFHQLQPSAKLSWHVEDGQTLKQGQKILTIEATVRTLLTGERTALNYLGHLSGIATMTAKFVKAIEGTKAKIVDTRKTLPSLRFAQKYAVRAGGGENHRYRLDDAILIKDNHIAFAGGIREAIQKARNNSGHMVKLEVEVDNLTQLKDALQENIDVVLLDNMPPATLKEAVELINGKVIAEASGGVTLKTVNAIAKTGVDIISIGCLTHSASSLDLGLDIDIAGT